MWIHTFQMAEYSEVINRTKYTYGVQVRFVHPCFRQVVAQRNVLDGEIRRINQETVSCCVRTSNFYTGNTHELRRWQKPGDITDVPRVEVGGTYCSLNQHKGYHKLFLR